MPTASSTPPLVTVSLQEEEWEVLGNSSLNMSSERSNSTVIKRPSMMEPTWCPPAIQSIHPMRLADVSHRLNEEPTFTSPTSPAISLSSSSSISNISHFNDELQDIGYQPPLGHWEEESIDQQDIPVILSADSLSSETSPMTSVIPSHDKTLCTVQISRKWINRIWIDRILHILFSSDYDDGISKHYTPSRCHPGPVVSGQGFAQLGNCGYGLHLDQPVSALTVRREWNDEDTEDPLEYVSSFRKAFQTVTNFIF